MFQAVCTQKLLFTSVLAGNAGSVHDARVFRLSAVKNFIDNPQIYFPNDSHLVGDAAYAIHSQIMVPFKDNGHLTDKQKNFNFCLSSARISIERAFGLWKARWRSIFDCLPMVTLKKIPEYLVGTCVLHNICILKGDMIDFDEAYEQQQQLPHDRLTNEITEHGKAKRDKIMNNLYMRINM